MNYEFFSSGFWIPDNVFYRSIEMEGFNPPELSQFGSCKVARIDNFPEINGKKGALLNWPWLKKRGFELTVKIQNNEYVENGFVQVIQEKTIYTSTTQNPKFIDFRYWARPMTDRISLLTNEELGIAGKEIFRKLDPIFVKIL